MSASAGSHPNAKPLPNHGIHPSTEIGTVRLTVSDLDRSRAFYVQVLGLRSSETEDGGAAFGPGAEDGTPLVVLHGDRTAAKLDRSATGLFHLAVLVPTRLDLGFALGRLVAARWPLDGASDHLVSEALYLSDPDGNGIEIYRDRSRDQWPRADGQLQMATLPLDLPSIAAELKRATGPQPRLPGHPDRPRASPGLRARGD